ncbi:MAG: hypothetical protein IJW43_03570 [Clostridia bacterium]|nr:hypothetical protein [Clostridia bacterium]
MDTAVLSKEEKRTKKALKYYKRRHLRNFFIWLWGVISFVLITVGGIAIVLGAIPAKTLFGEEKAGKAAEGSLLEVAMNIDNYTFGDIPFAKDLVDSITNTEIIGGKTLSTFIRFKVDDIDSLKITEFVNKIGSNPGEMVEVIASIDGVVGLDSLGDFKNLSAFSTWEEVTTEVDVESETFVPALYYYLENGEYVRAFNDDKSRIAPESATLYYGALGYVPIPQALGLISERLGREKVVSLISSLGGAEFDDDSVLNKIIGDTTVSGVGEISLDDINLNVLLPEEGNDSLYSILRGAAGLKTTDPVTVASLNGLDMTKVNLSGFLNPDEYEVLFNLLTDATGKTEDQITIADLSKIDVSDAKLSVLLGEKNSDNETLYNILEDVTNKAPSEITINDLAGFDLNGVKLTALFSIEENQTIYNMLADSFPGVAKEDLTIEHLQDFDMDTMKLSSVLDPTTNAELFDFLSDNLPGNPDIDEISINDLAKFKMDDIKLSSVLPYAGNEPTYKMLLSSLSDKTKDTLAVKDLNDFDLNEVKLEDVLGTRTDNLYIVLRQAAKLGSGDTLTIGSLTSASFDIGNVELSTVVTDSGNMFKILREATSKSETAPIMIKDLSSFDINKISLATVLPSPETHLRDLLEDACDIHPYEDIKLSHLTTSNFDIDRVYLYHILSADAGLQEILEDVYSLPYEEIKFGHMHNADGTTPFDITKLHLQTVVEGSTGNQSLDTLVKDSSVTIGNLGDKLNALSLYEVYGESSFTTKISEAKDTTRKFVKSEEGGKVVFTQSSSGTYYISKNAGVWLLLAFTGSDKVDGAPTKYTESTLTISSMQNGSTLSKTLSNATIRELIDAGIVTSNITNPSILAMTITEAIESLE